MNKKMTPGMIRLIVLQSIIVMLTVTFVGGAIITHNEFKATSKKAVQKNPESIITDVNGNKIDLSQITEQTTTTGKTFADYKYAYAGFNPTIIDVNKDFSKILLNCKFALPENYAPKLAEVVDGSEVYMDFNIAPYFKAMYDAAQEDGITLTPLSGYRSYENQKNKLENRIDEYTDSETDRNEATIRAVRETMLPGSSEHNAGLSVDICSRSDSFENSEEFEWLKEHAAKFGFILRYPKGEQAESMTGVEYKPWHFRFVGESAAKTINSKGITLEEYLGQTKPIEIPTSKTTEYEDE